MMPMGYPAENARPSKRHFSRKDNEELYRLIEATGLVALVEPSQLNIR